MKTVRDLSTAVCAIGATIAVGLASAGAAQAQCVTNDNSSPCHYPFPYAGSNSPNLIEQSDAIPLDVYPVNYSCLTGYWWDGSQWRKGAPGEQCGQNQNKVQLFNTATPGQLDHVLDNSATTFPNDMYIYF